MRRQRVVVIGHGKMGALHAEALKRHSSVFDLVGYVDPSPRTPTSLSRFATTDAALGSADAVIIATPIDAHAPLCEQALSKRKHVLVEKPICRTLDDAAELVGRAHASGSTLFVAHSERHNPVVGALLDRIGGETIREIRFERIGPAHADADPTDALLSLGVHDLDLASVLLGEPLELRSASADDADVALELRSRSGVPVRLRVARLGASRRRRVLVRTHYHDFIGDLANFSLMERPSTSGSGASGDRPLGCAGPAPLDAQAVAWGNALLGRPHRMASAEDGRRALALATLSLHRIDGKLQSVA